MLPSLFLYHLIVLLSQCHKIETGPRCCIQRAFEQERRIICDNLRFYLVIQHYCRTFVAEIATLNAILCRINGQKRYVYTRKRQLDKLPLG